MSKFANWLWVVIFALGSLGLHMAGRLSPHLAAALVCSVLPSLVLLLAMYLPNRAALPSVAIILNALAVVACLYSMVLPTGNVGGWQVLLVFAPATLLFSANCIHAWRLRKSAHATAL